jgi:predicted dehydrogenase
MLRLGIIGCGKVTQMFHIKAIKAAKNVEVYALADTSKQRMKIMLKTCKAKQEYTNYEKLLSDPNVDAISVNTPPKFHEEIVLRALEMGKHVLCEKPLAQTIRGCEKIKEKQLKTGLIVLPAHNYVFTPSLIHLEKMLESQIIGNILNAKFFFENNLKTYGSVTNFRILKNNGIVEDILPHILSVANPLVGQVNDVKEVLYWCKNYEICDNLKASMTSEKNVSLDIKLSWTRLIPRFYVKIYGTRGLLFTDPMRKPYTVNMKTEKGNQNFNLGAKWWTSLSEVIRFKHPSFKNLYEHFERLSSFKEEPRISIDDEIQMLKVMRQVSEWLEAKSNNAFL